MAADLSQTLLERLIERTLEGMSQQEKLAFVEKLFSELPPAAQQEFLLKLTRQITGAAPPASMPPRMPGPPLMHRMMEYGLREFGPWQMCCRVMTDLVRAPHPDKIPTATVARLFNALADETRLKIVKLLSEGERSVEELVQALGIAQSTTSHHLRVLKEAGLIQGEKRGRNIYYSLTRPL